MADDCNIRTYIAIVGLITWYLLISHSDTHTHLCVHTHTHAHTRPHTYAGMLKDI